MNKSNLRALLTPIVLALAIVFGMISTESESGVGILGNVFARDGE